MPESNWRQQHSPSPKSTTSMHPPLSKFYHGPVTGWNSVESSPGPEGTTFNPNPIHDFAPPLPPRDSAGSSFHGSPQLSQGWHSPAPSAPAPGQPISGSYILSNYALTPDPNDTFVNPTWDSGPTDTSTWGVNYKHKYSHAPRPAIKPTLPPRSYRPPDQSTSYASKLPISRVSATTIDVPLFLQPVAYDAAPAPPLPGHPATSSESGVVQSSPPPEPPRFPPPPPRKIPLDKEEEERNAPRMVPKRPQYDPQHSHDDGQPQIPQKFKRPHFDPQNSHNETNRTPQGQHQDQRPTLPPPQFASSDVESAPPLAPSGHEPSASPQPPHAQSVPSQEQLDTGHYYANQDLRQGPISPVRLIDQDPWASQPACAPSPEQQHATLLRLRHDRQSSSTADFSSNTAGKSTPESQQTSNTSYRETEAQANSSRDDHRGDDSFYWHSGRSSSDVGDGHSQNNSPVATPEASVGHRSSATNSTVVQREHHHPPIRSASLSPSLPAAYGASALGLGGPSDWEYFGDYEAEEIDDEELYSRPRPRDSDNEFRASAELPAERTAVSATEEDGRANIVAIFSKMPGTSPLPKEPLSGQSVADRSSQSFAQKHKVPGEGDYVTVPNTMSERSPTTPRPLSRNPAPFSNTSPEQRPDLDEVIRAWSEAPYVGTVRAESPHRQSKEEDHALFRTACDSVSLPHERAVGADVASKDTPSIAPLSSRTDNVPSLIEQPGHKNENSVVPSNISLDPQLSRREDKHETTKLKQLVPGSMLDNADVTPAEDTLQSTSTNTGAESGLSSNTFTISSLPTEATFTGPTGNNRSIQIKKRDDPRPRETSQAEVRMGYQDSPSQGFVEEPIQAAQTQLSDASLENAQPRLIGALSLPQDLPQNIYPDKKADDLEAGTDQLQEGSESSESKESVENLPPNVASTAAKVISEHSSVKEDATKRPRQTAASTTIVAGAEASSEAPPQNGRVNDPYADLDPWGRASLNRFAAMLREESRAEANKDKLNIFNVFTSRESRLRVVLYGTEDELVNPSKISEQQQAVSEEQEGVGQSSLSGNAEKPGQPEKGGFVKQVVQRVNTMTLQRSLKALPALPANRESVVGLPGNALAPLVVQEKASGAVAGGSLKSESPSDGVQYSPGGRPVVNRLSTGNSEATRDSLQQTTAASEAVAGANNPESPSSNAPIAMGSEDRNPAARKPAYRPPKYNEPRSEVKNYLANRKSIIRPYSTFSTLRQGTTEGGSTFGRGADVDDVSKINARPPAPTSQYSSASNMKNDDAPTAKAKSSGIESQPDLRRFVKADFDPLLAVLPESDASIPEPPRLNDLRSVLGNVMDDFSFIHQSVVAWDAKARRQREENERLRHVRQIESEQRIDSLFDDHEIGYGDISELESEFKRSEAARKADEDRSEYRLFVSDVFTLVWTRLHYELDQLIPHYEQYSSLMNDTLAGKDMFEDLADGFALAPTMNLFLTLHQKIEIRHQKAFEAVLERDRRLKKTEISPWYTLSNIAKVKQLEKQFEDAEKKAIIEYCQQRDTRANHLMDVLDQNTLRGVGANQDYMEAIMKAVRRIACGRAFASVSGSNEPTAGMEEVEKAKAVTVLLAASSEQIVQTFHVADMLLNSADYEVSVAKAKVADKMDLGSLATLKDERAKEDQKLMRDLEHRLALIREDTRRTNDEIVKLMLYLGITNGRADSAPAINTGTTDPVHEARIQRALEEAKRRNANKETAG